MTDYLHIKFGLIWIKETKVTEGRRSPPPPPQVENVLNRPGEIGLIEFEQLCQSYGHLCEILANFTIPAQKYGHVTLPRLEISKIFNIGLIVHLILGKVTTFLAEKLSTSDVMSQKPHSL